jgi:hypothetical protein
MHHKPEASSLFAYAQQARCPTATAADCTAVTAAADAATAAAAAAGSAVNTVRSTSPAFDLIANTTMTHTKDLISACDWRVTVQSECGCTCLLAVLQLHDKLLCTACKT